MKPMLKTREPQKFPPRALAPPWPEGTLNQEFNGEGNGPDARAGGGPND